MTPRVGTAVAIGLALSATVVTAAVVMSRRKVAPAPTAGEDEEDDDMPTPNATAPLKPIAVGEATDPKVAPLLAELQELFDEAGIVAFDVFDVTVMSKAPKQDGPDDDQDKTLPVAIPARALWPGLIGVAKVVNRIIVDNGLLGSTRTTGYRAPDYNKAVGGAPSSAHIRGDALDVWVSKAIISAGGGHLTDTRRKLKLAFASYFVSHPQDKIGFGAYTNDLHFDVNDVSGRRTWGDAADWVAEAKKIA